MMRIKSLIIPVLLLPFVVGGASSSHALSGDELIAGAKQCTRYIARSERQFAIPTHLLSAIATTESGRYHKGLGISVPWPWTINVEGKGYYFDTKEEAVRAVKKHMARGKRSIDIGCMQVNMIHHGKAFASIEEAFDPLHNVAYAASFLRKLQEETKSWKTAASHYHSRTPSRGVHYAGKVYTSWYKIIDKLRTARASTGQQPTRTVASVSKPVAFKSTRTVAKLPEQRGRDVAKHQTPRMKVIQVSSKQVSKQDTLVIKPPVRVASSQAVTVARVEPASLTVTQTVNVPTVTKEAGGKILRVAPTSQKKNQPTFIFTN